MNILTIIWNSFMFCMFMLMWGVCIVLVMLLEVLIKLVAAFFMLGHLIASKLIKQH